METAKNITILLIYTGGTIGMIKDYKSGALKAFDFKQLISSIPELNQLDCSVDGISLDTPIDSSNMNPKYWSAIAERIEDNYEKYDGFVVLHGSDTMSYTGSALSFMLENLAKPVILTGSQLPIGDLRTDAKENLITSIEIASLQKNGKPVVQEVGLYFEYKLYRANRTSKINAEHFEAFNSPNYPPLIESGVHLNINHHILFRNPKPKQKLHVRKNLDTNVALLKLYPGISKAFVEAVLGISQLKVLVLETFGAGNAPLDTWFLNALKKAIASGLHIVNITQCLGGRVYMGHYETSEALQSMQLINGKDVTTEAALAKAMYLLGTKVSHSEFRTYFQLSLRGEMAEK